MPSSVKHNGLKYMLWSVCAGTGLKLSQHCNFRLLLHHGDHDREQPGGSFQTCPGTAPAGRLLRDHPHPREGKLCSRETSQT